MGNKRLHVHSLPLLLFGVAATAVLVVSAATERRSPLLKALATPAVHSRATANGFTEPTVDPEIKEITPAGAIIASRSGIVMATNAVTNSLLPFVFEDLAR